MAAPSHPTPSTPTPTIIGGGLLGLATAFELIDAGIAALRIIDPAPVSGASHAAAGMLAPTAEMQYQQDPLYPLMFQSAALYPSLIARLRRHTDCDPGFWECGTWVVAAEPGDRELLRDILALQQRFDPHATATTTRHARREEPALSPHLAGVVHLPQDHQVNPRALCRALQDALQHSGRVTWEQRPATRSDLGPHTVVCAGLGAAELFPDLPLRPVYGDILRLRMPSGPLMSSVVRGIVHERPVYLVPRRDGELVLGATSREDGRPDANAGGTLDLLRDAARILPAVRDCDLVEVMAGARPGTPDDLPLIGRDPQSGAWISTGYFRHGILLAAVGAQLGAAALATTLDAAPAPADGWATLDAAGWASVDPFRFA